MAIVLDTSHAQCVVPFATRCQKLLLLRHNLVFDLLIRGARKNLFLHQLIFPLVGSTFDD